MKKREFIDRLQSALSIQQLPQTEIERHLSDYIELIADMTEDGMTEEEAVAKFDMPEHLAEQITLAYWAENPPKQEEKKLPDYDASTSFGKKTTVTPLLLIAIIFTSPIWLTLYGIVIAIILSIAAAAVCTYLALWAFVLSLWLLMAAAGFAAVCFLIAFAVILMEDIPHAFLMLGTSFICAGSTILLFHIAKWATIGLFKGTKWVVDSLIALKAKGGKKG